MATKWPKMASRRPQDGPRWPQVAQDDPKLAQKASKIGPRWATWAKMAPKWVQQGFRIAFLSYFCFFSCPFLFFAFLFLSENLSISNGDAFITTIKSIPIDLFFSMKSSDHISSQTKNLIFFF